MPKATFSVMNKKIRKIILIVAAVAAVVVLAVTCPDLQDHKESILNLAKTELSKQIDETVKANNLKDKDAERLSALLDFLLNAMDPALDKTLKVKRYVIFSIGHLESDEGEREFASVGILGHVFVSKVDMHYNFDFDWKLQ